MRGRTTETVRVPECVRIVPDTIPFHEVAFRKGLKDFRFEGSLEDVSVARARSWYDKGVCTTL